ncbi:diaminopimelate epimerase [Saprolegnia diclina VS20]|uniref:Diaminopimelate epimerase n=1 Tax=Saprolegnia diclina (strain VS20) TaxID=1156394 RepID=T0PY22_SAPDV|nr:diaminopimelate epimerase [Saprolegnia diclina VS20]EQC30434.1 diaminopimelate epimerase [Saprolegnia diclina VS20]|eukprot:XP_008616287.1 diaminopimelate epimerase [Saprolegnia diclina VS20]
MKVPFTKMQGAGNDFVLVDNRTRGLSLTPAQAIHICDRFRGVGAAGILLWEKSRTGVADWAWTFLQSDGDTADMCGNGARCFGRFVHDNVGNRDPFTFETGAGVVSVAAAPDNTIAIALPAPKDARFHEIIALQQSPTTSVHFANTGVPHAILFVPDVRAVDVQAVGREVRHHAHYAPRGTNVNFVQVLGHNRLAIRSYERGVEVETLACGTGVAAAVLVTARTHHFTSPVRVNVESGDCLEIRFEDDGATFSNVYLIGPAEQTFTGEIDL